MSVWEDLYWLAEGQHGAFSSRQADELGADAGWRARAERDRRIGRIFRGGFGVVPLLDDWTTTAAAQLVQPRAVLGGSGAAKLLGLDGVELWRPELLVPPGTRLRKMKTRHVSDLVVPEIIVVDGLRCTDEVRTIIDFAADASDDEVERAIESLLRRRPEAEALLRDRAEALSRPGKSGPARVLRVLTKLPDVRTESDLETVYWQVLRNHGVPMPERQIVVGRYRLDVGYRDIKLFVELDGYASHGSHEAFVKDRHRQNDVVGLDWVPLRFTDSDVRRFPTRTARITDREVRRRRARLVALDRV